MIKPIHGDTMKKKPKSNEKATKRIDSTKLLHWVTWSYVVFLTLLLWLPDPRVLLWGWQPGEEAMGYSHLITFSLLGLLVELGRRQRSFFFWASLMLGYTLLTEIVQECTGFRSFEVIDIAQDLAGLYLGFWLAALVKRFPFQNAKKKYD